MTQQPEEEKLRVGLVASAVVDELSKRYNLSPAEVADAVLWVREHREFVGKLRHGGYMAIVGTLVGTTLLVAWEGVKAYIKKVVE